MKNPASQKKAGFFIRLSEMRDLAAQSVRLLPPSASNPVPRLEHPPHHAEARGHEAQRHGGTDANVHIGLAVEGPAQAADQVNHGVEQRHLLPNGRQHVDAVEGAA